MDGQDWDLWAVIRSFSSKLTDSDKKFSTDDTFINPSGSTSTSDFLSQQNDNLFDFSKSSSGYDGLYEVYHRFITYNSQSLKNPRRPCTELKPIIKEEKDFAIPSDNQKRKKKLKKVVDVSGNDLVQDLFDPWDWQKSSQKCLKSSSRSKYYYKCSNISTNCPAKKHVQKTLDDENKFKVTYINEHDHPPPTTKHSRKRNSTSNIMKKLELSFDCADDQKEYFVRDANSNLLEEKKIHLS